MIYLATDSTADLQQKFIARYGLAVIPLNLHFGEDVFKDGEEIWAEEFYHRLSFEIFLPLASQPSPEEFQEFYRRIGGPGDTIISIHVSAKLSSTIKSARTAAKMLEGERNVLVVDSGMVSMALGMIVLEAAEALEKEQDLQEVLDRIEWVKDNLVVFFTVDSLEHLSRTGRIGNFSSCFGDLLNIKPLLSIENGTIVLVDKVRGNRGRIYQRLLELTSEKIGNRRAKIIILHADAWEAAKRIEETGREFFAEDEITISTIGPVVGMHTGPGALGLVALPFSPRPR